MYVPPLLRRHKRCGEGFVYRHFHPYCSWDAWTKVAVVVQMNRAISVICSDLVEQVLVVCLQARQPRQYAMWEDMMQHASCQLQIRVYLRPAPRNLPASW